MRRPLAWLRWPLVTRHRHEEVIDNWHDMWIRTNSMANNALNELRAASEEAAVLRRHAIANLQARPAPGEEMG